MALWRAVVGSGRSWCRTDSRRVSSVSALPREGELLFFVVVVGFIAPMVPPMSIYDVLMRWKVIDHYENPRNVGSLDKKKRNVGTGLVGAPACGDVMRLQVGAIYLCLPSAGVRLGFDHTSPGLFSFRLKLMTMESSLTPSLRPLDVAQPSQRALEPLSW